MTSKTSGSEVIRVCFPFIGNSVGGSHISTVMLIERLDRSVVEPVIVLHEEGQLANYLRDRMLAYELIDIPSFFAPPYWSLRNIYVLLTQTWRIARFLRRARIDIVHANDARIHFGWTLAARLAGAKMVWHQRTGSFGRSIMKLLMTRLCHEIVCISNFTVSALPKNLAPLAHVVANPFDTTFANLDRDAERAKLLAELALPPNTCLVGFFGNLVQQKRPTVFLRAAAELDGQIKAPRAYLLFGAERHYSNAELTELARRLGIGAQVNFMGFRTPIGPWMAACDVAIAPGVREGLGRSLVEAMIVGTPVVAADSGGHKDVIVHGENGLLAMADDPAAFAAAASRLLNNRELAARMADCAKSKAVRDYSLERHVESMTKIYCESYGQVPLKGLPGVSGLDKNAIVNNEPLSR